MSDNSCNVRTSQPDFVSGLRGFAAMCDRSLSIEDGPMLAAKFREAASVIESTIARAEAAEAQVAKLREALVDAAAHLTGAASAYRTYAGRSREVGRGRPDPFFTTRLRDFETAAFRARASVEPPAQKEPYHE